MNTYEQTNKEFFNNTAKRLSANSTKNNVRAESAIFGEALAMRLGIPCAHADEPDGPVRVYALIDRLFQTGGRKPLDILQKIDALYEYNGDLYVLMDPHKQHDVEYLCAIFKRNWAAFSCGNVYINAGKYTFTPKHPGTVTFSLSIPVEAVGEVDYTKSFFFNITHDYYNDEVMGQPG